uniref:Uncharacterized protein n=1 Tax=Timema douglasi TaxID=61478 RepID=A0A7R8VGQ9_TIMDO|nr:unnamed protein product [Timema douglasi]
MRRACLLTHDPSLDGPGRWPECSRVRYRQTNAPGSGVTILPPAAILLPVISSFLISLEELRLDRNVISDLPEALGRLGRLRILTIGYNCLQELPSFLLVMRALALLDFQGNRVDNEKLPPAPSKDEASLARINLRANLLKGNIVLGNYGVSPPGLELVSARCGAAILIFTLLTRCGGRMV